MKIKDYINVLSKGFKAWNEFRIESGFKPVDLTGINLSKRSLISYDFSSCILDKANLSKCHLGNANFSKSQCKSSNFRNAYFNNTNLEESDFRRSNLKATIIKNSTCRLALFNKADFSGSMIENSSFFRANCRDNNFCAASFKEVELVKAHFEGSLFRDSKIENSNLKLVKLNNSTVINSQLIDVDFKGSMLYNSEFRNCSFVNCDLEGTLFRGGKIIDCSIYDSVFRKINFRSTQLISDKFVNCDLSYSKIFGVSAWDLELKDTIQEELRITDSNQPTITIDNIEIAQFIYLLLNNAKLRNVINTISSKVVLILGRFTTERMEILQIIRDELRKKNYLPVLFDFENSANRDLTETVTTLASLSRFIIADITDPKSIPQELSHIVPNMPSIAVQPIILNGHKEYGMFEHFVRYPWVMDIIEYKDHVEISSTILNEILVSIENKVEELKS